MHKKEKETFLSFFCLHSFVYLTSHTHTHTLVNEDVRVFWAQHLLTQLILLVLAHGTFYYYLLFNVLLLLCIKHILLSVISALVVWLQYNFQWVRQWGSSFMAVNRITVIVMLTLSYIVMLTLSYIVMLILSYIVMLTLSYIVMLTLSYIMVTLSYIVMLTSYIVMLTLSYIVMLTLTYIIILTLSYIVMTLSYIVIAGGLHDFSNKHNDLCMSSLKDLNKNSDQCSRSARCPGFSRPLYSPTGQPIHEPDAEIEQAITSQILPFLYLGKCIWFLYLG